MRIDPNAPNVQVLGEHVSRPWQAYTNGHVYLCRAVRYAQDQRLAYLEPIASAPVAGGEVVTYRYPVNLAPIPPGEDPTPMRLELAVGALARWTAPAIAPDALVVFVAN